MAPVQNFAATIDVYTVRLTSANSNRDGTGTIVDIFTVGSIASPNSANGINVFRVSAKATGAVSTGSVSQIVLYLWNPGSSSYDARAEFSLTQSGSPSTTVPTGEGAIVFAAPTNGIPGLGVENNWKLAASATVVPSGGAIVLTVECALY